MLALVIATALIGVLGTAVGAEAKARTPALPGFTIPASNGYQVYVKGNRGGSVSMSAHRANASGGVEGITYSTQGRVSARAIRASFGKLGKVSVRFKPSGGVTRSEAPFCGVRKRVKTRLGVFKGRIRFRGEGGFSTAVASRAQATPEPAHAPPCSAFPPPDRSGVALFSSFRVFVKSVVIVDKATASSPVFVEAVTRGKRRGKVQAARFVTALGIPAVFTYDAAKATADIQNPPAPFQGNVHFNVAGGFTAQSTGTLTATFPVQGNVTVIGPRLKAVLLPSPLFLF